ncbi:MAG TPA: hypothetical protein DE312_09595 [Gallionella sp.]|nr:hypothetical protein [Gallionellaceae bacterium]MDP1871686.1 hypothetical protein [Gallionella sp.]OGS68193.1 MAG: hypothetical protein A2Z87_12665 [Gallionellales bacterium GWA2_54_124]HCI53547.1 hypothetical protein [Gallionella sp.]
MQKCKAFLFSAERSQNLTIRASPHLESGSDRVGALDFQLSPTEYIPRLGNHASPEALMEAAQSVQEGLPISKAMDHALQHSTSIGGARPKVMIETGKMKRNEMDRKLLMGRQFLNPSISW